MSDQVKTRPRVFIAEDSILIAMDLEDILKGHGCEVIGPVGSIKSAFALVDERLIDVAIVDYLLEDGNAGPLAQVLDAKGIPFALCTGAGEGEIAFLFPRTPILSKPYDAEDVARVVDSLIAARLANS